MQSEKDFASCFIQQSCKEKEKEREKTEKNASSFFLFFSYYINASWYWESYSKAVSFEYTSIVIQLEEDEMAWMVKKEGVEWESLALILYFLIFEFWFLSLDFWYLNFFFWFVIPTLSLSHVQLNLDGGLSIIAFTPS